MYPLIIMYRGQETVWQLGERYYVRAAHTFSAEIKCRHCIFSEQANVEPAETRTNGLMLGR